MIERGELPEEPLDLDDREQAAKPEDEWVSEAARERVRRSLYSGTEHLSRQMERGVDRRERRDKIFKLLLILLALLALSWWLYY